jgi:hypothetical protein
MDPGYQNKARIDIQFSTCLDNIQYSICYSRFISRPEKQKVYKPNNITFDTKEKSLFTEFQDLFQMQMAVCLSNVQCYWTKN